MYNIEFNDDSSRILSLQMSGMKEYELLTNLLIIRDGGSGTVKLVF